MWHLIFEALTAVGTTSMAVTTVWVIRQSKQDHQDAMKPVCVLVPEEGLDAVARFDVVRTQPDNPTEFLFVHCEMKNIGNGPAVKLRIAIRFSSNPVAQPEVELSPLGANQGLRSPIRVPVILNDDFNSASYQGAPGMGWELWLVYEDIFGNVFHTRHVKDPQQPWATFGVGEMKLRERVDANLYVN